MDDRNFDKKSAQQWIETIEKSSKTQRDKDIYPAINNWIDENSLQNVLDLGSGQGVASEKVNFENTKYTGLEPSPYLLKRAQENYPKHKFVLGGAYDVPFEDNAFDGVFSVAVWHLLKDINKANEELSRILKPNGKFLIVTANADKKDEWVKSYDTADLDEGKLVGVSNLSSESVDKDVLYLRPLDELLESFESSQFKVNDVHNFRIWTAIKGFKVS